jgi:hypothetical protein
MDERAPGDARDPDRRLGTPLIVMTALPDERIPSQVAALGDNARLLRKPFDLSLLIDAASPLLARRATVANSRSRP